jgi:hypothetical protein
MVLDVISIVLMLIIVFALPVLGYLVARLGQEEAGERPWSDRGYKS